jgi:hypothetical protein
MGFFGLGVLAFEVGEGHVQRFVTQPDADNVYSTAWGNFSVADDPFSAAAGHVTWLKPCRPLPSKCPLTTDSVAHLFIDSFLLDGLFYLRHIRAFSGSLIKRQVPRRFRLTGGIDLREPGSKGEGPAPQAFLRTGLDDLSAHSLHVVGFDFQPNSSKTVQELALVGDIPIEKPDVEVFSQANEVPLRVRFRDFAAEDVTIGFTNAVSILPRN